METKNGQTKHHLNTSQYDVEKASTWNASTWLQVGQELQGRASTDMTELYLATIFSGFQRANNYLRIQEYKLDGSLNPFDGTKGNMDKLEEAGKKLLKENIVKLNLDTFKLEETGEGTYAEALDRWADILYEVKKLRLERKSKEKRGRPFIETVRVPFGQIPAA